MATKSNKNLIIGIVAVAVVLVVAIVGVLVAKNGGDDTREIETEEIDISVTGPDYSDYDVSVDFGDYDTMYAQAKAIQNGEMVGKYIRIDGFVSRPMTKYSVVEKNEDGEMIGTEFIVEGLDEGDYPGDGERIVISGEVIEKEPLYYVIKTTPEFVRIIEADEEEGSVDAIEETEE